MTQHQMCQAKAKNGTKTKKWQLHFLWLDIPFPESRGKTCGTRNTFRRPEFFSFSLERINLIFDPSADGLGAAARWLSCHSDLTWNLVPPMKWAFQEMNLNIPPKLLVRTRFACLTMHLPAAGALHLWKRDAYWMHRDFHNWSVNILIFKASGDNNSDEVLVSPPCSRNCNFRIETLHLHRMSRNGQWCVPTIQKWMSIFNLLLKLTT